MNQYLFYLTKIPKKEWILQHHLDFVQLKIVGI